MRLLAQLIVFTAIALNGFFLITPYLHATDIEIKFSLSNQKSIHNSIGLIDPSSDFVYLGAFRLPNESSGDTTWCGGGYGLTFRPGGDPEGSADGFPGSLIGVGKAYEGMVSEFTIPKPVISPNMDVYELPTAKTLQGFVDVTDGRHTSGLTTPSLADVQFIEAQGDQTDDKLYWVMYTYYMPQVDDLTIGWCELDFSQLNSVGIWRFGSFPSSATSRYLFDIPRKFANLYLGGRYIASGRFRGVNGGSAGPAIFASKQWSTKSPPLEGASIDSIELLKYENCTLHNFSANDNWNDGVWLASKNKSAIVIGGFKGFRTSASGMETYGMPQPDEHGYKGYHSNPDYGMMLFYDPVLLSEVAKGNISSNEIQPYAVFNVHDYLYNSVERSGHHYDRYTSIGGMAFDSDRHILYVSEPRVEGAYEPGKPIIHVFLVKENFQQSDTEPPTSPQNLRTTEISADCISLEWDPSSDDNHVAGYVIFRNGWPIDMSVGTSYSDCRVNPNGYYEYRIIAWDSMDQRSDKSKSLVVETPPGEDTRVPIITDIYVTEISETSATINWYTDEPATTRVVYNIEYQSGTDGEYNDLTLTRNHVAKLENLPELNSIQRFEYYVYSTDAVGNENGYHEQNFRTLKSGETNSAPVINGIGAKRISAGGLMEFRIQADDLDRHDTIVFSADSLPEGATFDSETRVFSWTPTEEQVGIHRPVFSVSDGDQVDQETVSIIVQEVANTALNAEAIPMKMRFYSVK